MLFFTITHLSFVLQCLSFSRISAAAAVLDRTLAVGHALGTRDSTPNPAKTRRRQACGDTSAIYVRNDNDHDLDLNCLYDVSAFAYAAMRLCCGEMSSAVSGQQFTDRGYNVIVSWGNFTVTD
ncbi:hypothetical protein B0T17DRAFT_620076 [Bombardia bombarda]|uniref:Secreted protein n=1 Tax=Bombardia bombarda TaxID=252184 RepID=A0AA39WH48_9PEZI|nr:hypothetical protein B0T17DRAFT_620076 [Bombardia bombarda]